MPEVTACMVYGLWCFRSIRGFCYCFKFRMCWRTNSFYLHGKQSLRKLSYCLAVKVSNVPSS